MSKKDAEASTDKTTYAVKAPDVRVNIIILQIMARVLTKDY